MVGILGTKALALAYLHRALDLPWLRFAGQRSKSRSVLLSYPLRCSLAESPPARPNPSRALNRRSGNDRNFCRLGDSVLSGVTFSLAFAGLVTRNGGCISRRRRPI